MATSFQPIIGFCFSVLFELPNLSSNEYKFQKVSGLSASLQLDKIKEGGRISDYLSSPVSTSYTDLVLTRGLALDSTIRQWCEDAILEHNIIPVNLTINLLNSSNKEQGSIIMAWKVLDAIPISWSISDFNAEESSLVTETIKCKYRKFEIINL